MSAMRLHCRAWARTLVLAAGLALAAPAAAAGGCRGTLYLTLDTGNMAYAEAIAETLRRHEVRATFFLANEKTTRGDDALDAGWSGYWAARAREGHAFGSHTWRHGSFLRDVDGGVAYRPQFPATGVETLDAAGVCAELKRVDTAFRAATGRSLDPLWRAPGGRTTPGVLAAAKSCGYAHVGWAPAGFHDDAPGHLVAPRPVRAEARRTPHPAQGARLLLRDAARALGLASDRGHAMLPEPLAGWFGALQGWLFQALVLPLLQAGGLAMYTEDAFNATEDVLWGLFEVGVLVAILLPLERRFPAERFARGRAVRTDVVYTLIHRLGLFPLAFFFTLRPLIDALQATLHQNGVPTPNLESLLPALAAHPVASFAAYLVLIDFTQYLIHRGQHAFGWWWALHAVHHSQRWMTFWTDNRNHLLDSAITDSILALVALAIGVPPAQFALLIVLPRLLESVAHANIPLSFGALGDRLLVSPRYHRLHHALVASPHGDYRGANYAVLFPLWDVLFGTADFRRDPGPTGIDDQLAGRDYGEGFWAQQWLGIKRLAGRA